MVESNTRRIFTACSLLVVVPCLINNSLMNLILTSQHNPGNDSAIIYNVPTTKPDFIIHIGPAKTATTTLQDQLTMYKDLLVTRDNIVYAGGYYKNGEMYTDKPANLPFAQTLLDTSCHYQVSKARHTHNSGNNNSSNTVPYYSTVPCWQQMLDNFKLYQDKNILFSDEILSFRTVKTYNRHLDYNNMAQPMDWIALYDSIGQTHNIIVLINYRRYFEWLPSAKQQVERVPNEDWPATMGGKSRSVVSFFPHYAFKSVQERKLLFWYTDRIYEQIRPYVPHIKLVNMHESDKYTPTTHFICTAVKAAHACRQAQSVDKIDVKLNPSVSHDYNVLAVRAVEHNLIDPKVVKRPALATALKQFHKQQSPYVPLPRKCPSLELQEQFLNISIALEEKLMPDFANRQDHAAAFYKAINSGVSTMCDVDGDVLFQNGSNWREFVIEYNLNATQTSQ